jgi:hypothetical protein
VDSILNKPSVRARRRDLGPDQRYGKQYDRKASASTLSGQIPNVTRNLGLPPSSKGTPISAATFRASRFRGAHLLALSIDAQTL